MHRTALTNFGEKNPKTHDWFDAKSTEMSPIIEAKRTAPIEYNSHPAKGTCRFSDLPEAMFNKPWGDV